MNLSPNPAAEIRESIGQIRSGFCFDVKESKTSRRPRLTQTRFTLPSIWRRRHRSGREKFRQVSKVRERLRGNVARSRVFLLFLLFLSFSRLYLLRRDSLDSHTHSSTIRISRVIGWEWWSIPAPRDWSNDVVRRYLSGGGQQLVDQLHVADHIVLVGLHF